MLVGNMVLSWGGLKLLSRQSTALTQEKEVMVEVEFTK